MLQTAFYNTVYCKKQASTWKMHSTKMQGLKFPILSIILHFVISVLFWMNKDNSQSWEWWWMWACTVRWRALNQCQWWVHQVRSLQVNHWDRQQIWAPPGRSDHPVPASQETAENSHQAKHTVIPKNRYTKKSNIQRVGVTWPSYCFSNQCRKWVVFRDRH